MKSNAQKVAELNNLWGNFAGDLANPNAAVLRKQAKLCLEESIETVEASDTSKKVVVSYEAILANADIPPVDLIGLADGIGAMLTVAYGLAHAAGFDADKIYDLVHESNMTKFIRSEEEEIPALSYYWDRGYPAEALEVQGSYPYAYIRAVKEMALEGNIYIPAGKILKNMVTFKEPDFFSLLPSTSVEASPEEKVADTLRHMKTGVA